MASVWYYPPVGEKLTRKLADSWHAPRDGGKRQHKGIDMMCRSGAPAVAVCAGTVKYADNDLGGYAIRLYAVDGCTYYYAHLHNNGRVKNGAVVTGGTVIGYCDSSGNASKTAPHLHFERRPGGVAQNPTSFVKSLYESDGVTPKRYPVGAAGIGAGVGASAGVGVGSGGVDDSTDTLPLGDAESIRDGALRIGEVILGFVLCVLAVVAITGADKAILGKVGL